MVTLAPYISVLYLQQLQNDFHSKVYCNVKGEVIAVVKAQVVVILVVTPYNVLEGHFFQCLGSTH